MKGKCEACLQEGDIDRAHILSRGAGGTYEENNIMALCRSCHQEMHWYGWPAFAERNLDVHWALKRRGWEVKEIFGQRKLVKK